MGKFEIKRAELSIIHNEISSIIGYDDGTNPYKMPDEQVLTKYEAKLKLLKLLLRSRKKSLEMQIEKGDESLKEELIRIEKKIQYYDGEL